MLRHVKEKVLTTFMTYVNVVISPWATDLQPSMNFVYFYEVTAMGK